MDLKHIPQVVPSHKRASDKIAAYINSCGKTSTVHSQLVPEQMRIYAQLNACKTMLALFKLRYPNERLEYTKLACLLQLKTTELYCVMSVEL